MKKRASSEAIGLLTDYVKLYEEMPYIELGEHPWRTLKAKGSERDIPLIGTYVWVHKHVNLSFTNVSLSFGLCLRET